MALPEKLVSDDHGELPLTLFAVMEKDAHGRPSLLRPLGLDDKIKLSEDDTDNWFITGYLHQSGFHPRKESNGD